MPPEPSEHYFDESPRGVDRRREIDVRIWGRDLRFTSSTGVFSQDRLDKATAVLMTHSPPPVGGTLLDLGCGWGPIACSLALAAPAAAVWAIDTNSRALDLTSLNASRLGVDVRTATPDEVPADLRFDQIWSNPPIRIGKPALHDLLLRWLPRLAHGGTARLVVAKNLGADSLQRWLVGQGWPTDRIASENGFRVLQLRPKETPTPATSR